MPISNIVREQYKEINMNKMYSKEFISEEIAALFNSVEEFVEKKDSMIEAIRYMYLNTYFNN